MCMSPSSFYALKRAIESARAEATGHDEYFRLSKFIQNFDMIFTFLEKKNTHDKFNGRIIGT